MVGSCVLVGACWVLRVVSRFPCGVQCGCFVAVCDWVSVLGCWPRVLGVVPLVAVGAVCFRRVGGGCLVWGVLLRWGWGV